MSVYGFQEYAEENITIVNSEAEENGDSDSGRNTALSLTLAALGFASRLATGIFTRGRKNVDSLTPDSRVADELDSQKLIEISGEVDSPNESSLHNSDVIDNGESSDRKQQGTPEHSQSSSDLKTEESEKILPDHIDDNGSFKRFDIAKDPLDHYFLSASEQVEAGISLLFHVLCFWTHYPFKVIQLGFHNL